MGYSTDFLGELKFTTDLTAKQLAKVKSFLGEDCRDHPEWNTEDLFYVNLELLDDFSGLKWDGSEKTNDLDEIVNVVINEMRKEYPDFGLEGKLLAQGEELTDRWLLSIENGRAVKKKIELKGTKVTCPHCGEIFILESDGM